MYSRIARLSLNVSNPETSSLTLMGGRHLNFLYRIHFCDMTDGFVSNESSDSGVLLVFNLYLYTVTQIINMKGHTWMYLGLSDCLVCIAWFGSFTLLSLAGNPLTDSTQYPVYLQVYGSSIMTLHHLKCIRNAFYLHLNECLIIFTGDCTYIKISFFDNGLRGR
jgi:hypothetical protein